MLKCYVNSCSSLLALSPVLRKCLLCLISSASRKARMLWLLDLELYFFKLSAGHGFWTILYRTEFFPYSKGVRQRCILSPLIFNLYINELATIFDNTNSAPFIFPNGTKLSCLLYADDLIILSKSRFGLGPPKMP